MKHSGNNPPAGGPPTRAAKGKAMTLKYNLESMDGVDEAHKPLYKEAEGGGFVLDVEGVVSQGKFAEVNQRAVDATTEAARRRKTNERVVSKLGLEDAGGLDDAIDALLSKRDTGGKVNADQEAVIAQIKQAHETELNGVKSQVRGMQTAIARATFQAELSAAGFPAKAAEMFAAANMTRVNIDDSGKTVIMSENGNPLAGSGADGFATFGDLSQELAAAMPEFLVDKGKGGGGKAPASGGNATPNGKFGALAAKIPGFSDLPKN